MALGECPVTGKLKYEDRHQALVALAKLRRRRAGHKTERACYQCRHCRAWHLTSMGEKPQVRRRMEPVQRWRWAKTLEEES